MVVRAAAMGIGGEAAMTAARRLVRHGPEAPEAPEWLVAAAHPEPEVIRTIWRQ
jgi:hypothetical protein